VSRRVEGQPAPLPGGFRKVGIIGRGPTDDVRSVLERVAAFARSRGVTLFPERELRVGQLANLPLLAESGEGVDLLVTLGGDGTLLRGVRRVAAHGTPVLGVNMGRLGFLTSMSPAEVEKGLEQAFAGEALVDPRFTVDGQVFHADGSSGPRLWALNDLVLHKGGVARVVRLDLKTGPEGSQERIGSFSGDGVIVATPTGSTAYSLSAGGPVIVPTMDCLVVTPISPHTMAMRPLVLPDRVRLVIEAADRAEDLVVTADGQVACHLDPGDRVVIEKGTYRVALVRLPGQTYFDTLRRVLNWAV
jgi:NAD+ kinase